MDPQRRGEDLADRMWEETSVHRHSRIAVHKTLGEMAHQKTQGMVDGLEAL